MRFLRADTEMMKLDLRLSPRKSDSTLKCRGVVVFIRQIENFPTRWCNHRPECNAHGGPGRNPHLAPKAEDRIEHCPNRTGERSAIHHGDRRSNLPTPAEKTGPVSFILDIADASALDDSKVSGPYFRFAG